MKIWIQQSRVILWKNFKVRKHHPFQLLFEIMTPIILFVILAVANAKRDTFSQTVYEQYYTRVDIMKSFPPNVAVKVFYAPRNEFVDKLMDKVSRFLHIDNSEYIGLNSQREVEIERLAIHRNDSNSHIMAVIFDEASPDDSSHQFFYKIMYELVDLHTMKTKMLYLMTDRYVTSGFATLQYALDKSYIELKGQTDIKTNFYIQQFPRPKSQDIMRGRYIILIQLTPFTILGFLSLQFLVPTIVEEKRSGIKELMKLMGLKTEVMWFGWFVSAVIPPLVSIIITVILLKVTFKDGSHPVLESSEVVLFLHLFLYCLASIIFMFAVSALCQHPILAAAVSIVLWCGSLIILDIMQKAHRWTIALAIWCIFFPNMPLYYGYDIIESYELKGMVFHMSYLASYDKISEEQKITMLELWIMYIVEIILYGILTLYFEAVMPGKYGIPKTWLFPCTKCCRKKPIQVEDDGSVSDERTVNSNYEKVNSANFTPGIEIYNLKKEFKPLLGSTKLAVAGITLNIYKDQITVLLGHNGAGKTTTLFMLTGMIFPSSGQIKISGYDVQHDIDRVRENLGLCPQQNMLHKDLTVEQHLMFFSMVKGFSKKEAFEEAKELIGILRLKGHEKDYASQLSGGMKRRLCLGISLCGNPSVIILDEPTSGLDPELRREIWDILLEMRGQRTILITTHDMEEADVLGDFIAIMDHGRVKCYGTSMFLKNKFGTGYHLEIVKDGPNRDKTIIQLVRSVVPEAAVRTQLPTLIVFSLPTTGKPKFPSLFTLLEENKTSAGIMNTGVSLTTMEEVFLKVGEGEKEKSQKQREPSLLIKVEIESDLEEPPRRCSVQFLMMFLKSILFTRRNFLQVIGLALIPIIMTIIAILITGKGAQVNYNDPVELKLSTLGETNVLYENDTQSSLLAEYYAITIKRFGSSAEAISSPILETLLSRAKEDFYKYFMYYIVAADFKTADSSITALYSGNRRTSVPVSINAVTSALLKAHTKSGSSEIGTKSQPFERSKDSDFVEKGYWPSVVVLHVFWLANFISLPLIERVTEIKHLQLMTGVAPFTYWLPMYLWDFLLNIVVTGLIITTAFLVDYDQRYSGGPELLFVFCMFTSYIFSALPLTYLISYARDNYASGYAVAVICFLVAYMFKLIFTVFLLFIDKDTVDLFTYAASIIPFYALVEASIDFTRHVNDNNLCRKMTMDQIRLTCIKNFDHKCCVCTDDECAESRTSYFQTSGERNSLFRLLLTMLLTTFLYFALLLIIDSGVIKKFTAWVVRKRLEKKEKRQEESNRTAVDSDVLKEEQKIEKVLRSNEFGRDYENILLVWKLKKNYNLQRTAVESVSFAVKPGECFGLLGVNGAGKSTTFKMLTGTVARTHGDAAIFKWVLSREQSKFLAQIGYCPQTDAIIACIKPWEHLILFCRLRGLKKKAAKTETKKWIDRLGLQEYQDKLTGTLSGGNKRKTCTGIALVGNPFLVMLDEPTSGVDPVSRRSLWNVLENVQRKGQSLVLTSHSMDECEAMCDRLAIMVNGRFQCLGNIPHLKQKFAQGYTVKIKLNMEKYSEGKVKNLKNAIGTLSVARAFFLKDEHKTMLHYHVTDPTIPWSNIFKTLEDLKASNAVMQDYSISQTTLEEIFLAFAKNQ